MGERVTSRKHPSLTNMSKGGKPRFTKETHKSKKQHITGLRLKTESENWMDKEGCPLQFALYKNQDFKSKPPLQTTNQETVTELFTRNIYIYICLKMRGGKRKRTKRILAVASQLIQLDLLLLAFRDRLEHWSTGAPSAEALICPVWLQRITEV